MTGTASTIEIVLTLVLALAVFGGLAALAAWGRRRKDSGDEGGTTDAEGAETILGNWFT